VERTRQPSAAPLTIFVPNTIGFTPIFLEGGRYD
jgi:hypothetical protein